MKLVIHHLASGISALSVDYFLEVGRMRKEDVTVLATLGMFERTEQGGLICPFTSMHIDMYLQTA